MLKTHYDYTNLSRSITKGCKTDYDKVRAIYKWMCDNIEYDTSYKIYDADNCFDNRKGVCQAYCNLFYNMAKSIGIKVEIISGISKDSYGNIGSTGHSWLFAYVEDNYGILLDPTWGAGSVSNGKFVKEWKTAGVNEYNLYQLITSNNVKELPIFYSNMGQNLKIVNVPMTNKK